MAGMLGVRYSRTALMLREAVQGIVRRAQDGSPRKLPKIPPLGRRAPRNTRVAGPSASSARPRSAASCLVSGLVESRT